jgi:hypothetical protein
VRGRSPATTTGYIDDVSNVDDDDWVGTPPEGHHTRDRARPDFWRNQRPVSVLAVGMFVIIVAAVIYALVR